jgi:peptide/nickel transport system substrate-binding protein
METKNREIWKMLLYGLFALLFAVVTSQLFLQKPLKAISNFTMDVLFDDKEVDNVSLTVVYPADTASLEPTLFMPTVRQRLVNIYEPLVKVDGDFHMEPALALSWGLIDELTWEIYLRPDVIFHDGTSFEVNDVVASIDRAQSFELSTLKDITESIDEIAVIDDFTLRLKTKDPDPLLLQKLSQVLIVPFEYGNDPIDVPVGTGSYVFSDWEVNERMVLKRNQSYWGDVPKFEEINLITKVDKSERVMTFLDGEADLISFVPYDAVEAIHEKGFEIKSVPNLEVQFLLFNNSSQYLSDVEIRKAVSMSINPEKLAKDLGGGYVKPVNQYVSTGVFGYSSSVDLHDYNPVMAEMIAWENDLEGITLRFHLQKGLDVLGEHVRKSLAAIGINAVVSYLDADKFLESLLAGDADMYFFGFKSDLGDSIDFLKSIVYSEGDFNVIGYENPRVDYLIESALTELEAFRRSASLNEAMEIIVEEDYVGVPLIEYETVYATNQKIMIEPRLDGLIYFDELIIN